MCVLICVNQIGFGSIVPVIALYADSFGVSATAVGLTVAIYGFARFLMNVPTGSIADRFGRRKALAAGGAVSVVGNLVCGLAPDYLTFVIGRFIAGAGAAMVLTGGQIVIADVSVPSNRGRMLAIYQSVFIFAVGVGPLPGGVLADLFGLRAPFLAYAGLATVVSLLALWRVPETRGLAVRAAGALAAPPFRQQLTILATSRGFLLVSLVSFASFFARTGGLFTLIPTHAKNALDLSASQIGMGLALASLGALAAGIPAGILVDRYGRKAVIVPATIVSGVAMSSFALAPDLIWFVVSCLFWALATGMASSAPAAYAADTAPSSMTAAAMSMYRTFADLGYIVGPLTLGFVADTAGVPAGLYGTAVILVICAIIFAVFAPEHYRRPVRAPAPAASP